LTEACFKAIDKADALGAFVHKTPEVALDRARAADARLARQAMRPFDDRAPHRYEGFVLHPRCTQPSCASAIFEGFKPEYESHRQSAQLRDAGAVMLGKLNMDEFAMGSSNETSTYGNAINPWRRGNNDAALTPGGSSGGIGQPRLQPICALRRDRHRYGRVDPPACRLCRDHRGNQADLRALLALGDRGLCQLARSSGPDDQDRCAMRRSCWSGNDARTIPRIQHICRSARARFRSRC
jgi:hypothetical protein